MDVEPESRHTQGSFLQCLLLCETLCDKAKMSSAFWWAVSTSSEDSVILTKALSSSIHLILEIFPQLLLGEISARMSCSVQPLSVPYSRYGRFISCLYLLYLKTAISLWRWKTPNGSKGIQNHFHQTNSSSWLSGTPWEFPSAPALVLIYLEPWWFIITFILVERRELMVKLTLFY